MCFDDNVAPLSTRYHNAQLSAMWQNAVDCVAHGGKKTAIEFGSSDYHKNKYTRSLAEFHFAGRHPPTTAVPVEDLFFCGTFGEPRLEFICNHEVALYLKLKKGHFNKVYPKKTAATGKGYKYSKKDKVPFENVEVAFRVKFSRRNLSGKDTRIGNGANVIQMVILDFSSAEMVLFGSSLPLGTSDALEWYLKQYLFFLQKAGHHVRFDLPDFDDDKYRSYINYSLVTQALESEALCAGVTVHGIHESKINEFLRDTWLDVVSKAMGFCGEPPTDMLSSCLIEIRSAWVGQLDHHFNIRFGPPGVRALCNHEVVLYFRASKIHFYNSEDFNRKPINTYVDWEFAFVVDVVEDKSTPVPSLKLDLSTARFCPHLSTTFSQVNIHFTYLISFLEYYYLELLVKYDMLCIYYPGGYNGGDELPEFPGLSDDESQWELEKVSEPKSTIPWTETVKQIKLYSFDHMIAISEVSINALFASLRKAAPEGCLAKWRHKDAFHAEFENIRIKLLSESKALVTFTVDDGYLTLEDKKRKYNFTSWTIAYEVEIKMVDQTELHCNEGWLAYFSNLILGTREGDETHSTTKHIILDFKTAKYVYKHSSMPSMWNDGPIVAIDQLKSFIYFMEKYLVELSVGGHNIIHSTPIFPSTHHFGLTSVSFKILAKDVVTITNCMFKREAPVIMVYGMMGGRPLPVEKIAWGHGWIIPGRTPSHGTMCLSRQAFLEDKLLATLEVVNRRTTVVPRFPGDHEDEWKVHLTTWDQHHYRKNEQCHWKPVPRINPGWLEYAWEYRDEWSYEHGGTHHSAFAYSVLCHTKNQLLIPTTYRRSSLEIILHGESVLRIGRKHDEKSNWNKRSSAKWSVKMHVNSEFNGLHVTIVDSVQPVFDEAEAEGEWDIDTHKLLEEHLPRVVDIKEAISDLKSIFEGAWEYSCAGSKTYTLVSPVFTETGDLIVQLGGFAESSTTTARPIVGGSSSPLKLPPTRLESRPVFDTTPIESFSLNGIAANGSVVPNSFIVPKANGYHPVDGIKNAPPIMSDNSMSDSSMSMVGSERSLPTPPAVETVGEALTVEEAAPSTETVETPPVVTEALAVDESAQSNMTPVTPPVGEAVGEALAGNGSGTVLGEFTIGEITESMAIVSGPVSGVAEAIVEKSATNVYVPTPTMELPKLDGPIKLPPGEEVAVTTTVSEPDLAAAGF